MDLKRTVLGLAGALALVGAARAQEITAAPAGAAPFPIGAASAWALRDGRGAFANDGKTFGLGIDPAEVARVLAARGAPSDQVQVSVDALLVKAKGRVMLFDTGLGPKFHGALMESLVLAGVKPGDVTDVFITHGHGDHVGGLVNATGEPAFARAVVHISTPEWAWLKTQPGAATLVRAIAPQVRPFPLGAVIVPGVTSAPIAGHTPGHTAYLIGFGRDSLVDIGDTGHSSIVSLARPAWKIQFDTDKDLGAKSRTREVAKLASTRARVFAPHFPYPGVGRIESSAEGYRWSPEDPLR